MPRATKPSSTTNTTATVARPGTRIPTLAEVFALVSDPLELSADSPVEPEDPVDVPVEQPDQHDGDQDGHAAATRAPGGQRPAGADRR